MPSRKTQNVLKNIQRYEKRLSRLEELVKSKSNMEWTQWITVREAAIKLRVKQETIVEMVESSDNMECVVGIRSHSGSASFDNIGDYRIEHYEDE